jgi:flagellar hook-basal body complex protein FliE
MAAPVRFPNLTMPTMSPLFGAENRPGSRLSVVPEGEGLGRSALDEAMKAGVADAPGADSAHGVHKPFSEFLKAQVENVNGLQKEADTAVAAMVTGQSGNLHETMIALDKADVSFRMATKVRTKIIDAYHEVMRMNI